MNGVSVIICSYNGADKLPATLKSLSEQIVLPGIPFEIVLINNNSTDDTASVVRQTWASLDEPFPLRIFDQPIPGLSYARAMGIMSAQYEYLIFCDDDNWLCKDYLSKVYSLFRTKAEIAMIGGVGEPVFEKPPPAWFYELEGFGYALGTEGRQTGYVDLVYGAGMAIRKSVLENITGRNFAFVLSDRNGKGLSSGGDSELCLLICLTGNKIFLDTSLVFQHFMTKDRMNWKYYLRLRRSFGKANAYLELYNRVYHKNGESIELNPLGQYLLLGKVMIRFFPYLVYPEGFKNAQCANVVQRVTRQITLIRERKKLRNASVQVVNNLKAMGLFKPN
ncbi:MAG TPA: glycosyltransferase [Puia sp.]